ncbi:MAG TPA: MMPL family transporter [Waterburya sp.]|jgi:RND superfamily putative drug exporter
MKQDAPNRVCRQSIFAKLGRLSYRYRVLILVIWGVMLLLSLVSTPHLDYFLKGVGMAYEAGEATRAEQLLKQELNVDPDALTVVFESANGSSLDERKPELEQILTQVRRLPSVSSVVSAAEHPEYRSSDGTTEYSVINLKVRGSEAVPAIDSIEQVTTQSHALTLKTYVTGKPVVDRDAQRISKADLSRAESIALPLTLIALLFVFGSAVAAAMPVAMGVMAVSVTFGLLFLVALKMDLSVFALNTTSMLGLGLGIDYSLLIVNRFREELLSGTVEQAVIRTVDTAGRSVFFSGLTVCIGMVSLLMFPILILRSLGVAGSLVVLLSVVAALTLLPAVLAILGKGINRWRVVRPAPQTGGIWTFFARNVVRYGVAAVAVVLVILAVFASPFLQARFGIGDASILPSHVPAREGVEVLKRSFGPGEISPILLAVSTKIPADRILSEQHIATLYNLVTKLKTDSRIAKVSSIVNIDLKLNLENYQQLYRNPQSIPLPTLADAVKQLSSNSTTLIVVNSHTDSNDQATRNLVQELRGLSLDGLQVQVGGLAASQLDTLQVVYRRFPLVLAAIMAVTFVVLCLLLKSVVLPLKAIMINLLSIGASFGALVFIFQEGNFHTWLNFTPLGYLDILLPVILFCVLFGLSMDYEVFLLSRIKEAYDRSGNNSASVVEGLERTGRIITSAALLMIIVAGAFALTSIIFVKALGLGIAIAVFIDATLIRAILVPATMHLMGKWNWWAPKFLGLDRIKLELD